MIVPSNHQSVPALSIDSSEPVQTALCRQVVARPFFQPARGHKMLNTSNKVSVCGLQGLTPIHGVCSS